MAWNPSPKVAAARDFGKKFKKQKVIILALDEQAGTFELTSYGETKKKCAEAKVVADDIHDLVMNEVLPLGMGI